MTLILYRFVNEQFASVGISDTILSVDIVLSQKLAALLQTLLTYIDCCVQGRNMMVRKLTFGVSASFFTH